MHERIKKLRSVLHISQQKLADDTYTSQSTVAAYEKSITCPTNQFIQLLCIKYNVNEHWLRTGEGEMFRQLSRDEELAAAFGRVLRGDDNFKKRFIAILCRMDENCWIALRDFARQLMDDEGQGGEKN